MVEAVCSAWSCGRCGRGGVDHRDGGGDVPVGFTHIESVDRDLDACHDSGDGGQDAGGVGAERLCGE
jgi:hypothetical protein